MNGKKAKVLRKIAKAMVKQSESSDIPKDVLEKIVYKKLKEANK